MEIHIHLGLLWLRQAEHDSPSGFYVSLHSLSQDHCTAAPGPSFFAAVQPDHSKNTEILTIYKMKKQGLDFKTTICPIKDASCA